MAFENYVMAERNSFTEEYGNDFSFSIGEDVGFVPVEFIPDHDYSIETLITKITDNGDGSFKYELQMNDEHEDTVKNTSLTLKKGDRIEIALVMNYGAPSWDYDQFVVEITEAAKDKLAFKIVGIDKDNAEDEDYDYVPFECEVGEQIPFEPSEAVFSMDVTLKEIKKSGDDFIMTLFVKADDEEVEDQTLSYTIHKGTHLEFDDYDFFMCGLEPDRETADVEIVDVSEKSVVFRRC